MKQHCCYLLFGKLSKPYISRSPIWACDSMSWPIDLLILSTSLQDSTNEISRSLGYIRKCISKIPHLCRIFGSFKDILDNRLGHMNHHVPNVREERNVHILRQPHFSFWARNIAHEAIHAKVEGTRRYARIPLEERIFKLCHQGVESKEHYVCHCSVFYEIRGRYHCLLKQRFGSVRKVMEYEDQHTFLARTQETQGKVVEGQ